MEAQRTEILKALPEFGWRVAALEQNPEWWADEMWQLQSVWSSIQSRAYLTFLVDPMFEGDRKKGEGVWAVMASPSKPDSWIHGEGGFTLTLGRRWKDRLPDLLEHLSKLRNANEYAR